jgi:hypothetical protein
VKIRFSEHITVDHREGILSEIAEMGASTEQVDQDSFIITPPKLRTYSFVFDFLRQQQGIGNLELGES